MTQQVDMAALMAEQDREPAAFAFTVGETVATRETIPGYATARVTTRFAGTETSEGVNFYIVSFANGSTGSYPEYALVQR